jgi:hypothetical protein
LPGENQPKFVDKKNCRFHQGLSHPKKNFTLHSRTFFLSSCPHLPRVLELILCPQHDFFSWSTDCCNHTPLQNLLPVLVSPPVPAPTPCSGSFDPDPISPDLKFGLILSLSSSTEFYSSKLVLFLNLGSKGSTSILWHSSFSMIYNV